MTEEGNQRVHVTAMDALHLHRDCIFYVLLGTQVQVIGTMLKRSALRIEANTQSNNACLLLQAASKSVSKMQAVFILFLFLDDQLRAEVSAGTALSVRCLPFCEYRAASLYSNLYKEVLNDWLKSDRNGILSLIQTFKNLYLVS